MTSEILSTEGLDRQVAALIAADRPTDVFKALLEGTRLAVPRAAVFLVRQSQIKGWGSVGFGPEAAQRQREHSSPADAGWLGALAASDEPVHEVGSPGGDLDFGQPPSAEAFGIAVRVKNRAIALILAERSSEEFPWYPSLLTSLVRVAQLRLDFDLLRRKVAAAAPAPAAEPPAAAPPPEPRPAPPPVADTGAEAPTGLHPAEEKATAGLPDDKQLESARRYARLVATDIRLYNEDAVMQGRRNGDLVERLGDHLRRGKETFLRRHGSLGPSGLQALHEAYVQVLAAGDEKLMPTSVLD